MQFYKKKEGINLNNEYIKMIEQIKSDQINNVCFECGVNNPEYISINNGVFICQECIQGHFQFPQEISQIKINDLYSLNNNEVKKIYLGGNKKLIEFINFDFPRLKQFPPNVLYKTRAIDYYRKKLEFLVKGGTKPLKPIFESAYQLINLQNKNNNPGCKNDLFLSPKIYNKEKAFNTTQLTPILEGNQLEDENNVSSFSEEKEEDKIKDKPKNSYLSPQDTNTKNESTFIYSPQKPKALNGSSSAFISNNSSFLNKSLQNDNNKNNYKITTKIISNKKNINNTIQNENIQDNNNIRSNNINEDIKLKLNIDKNISTINIADNINTINNTNEKNFTNNYNVNTENLGEDNTIRIIDDYINLSKEND